MRIMRIAKERRSGAAVVEAAIVLPVLLVFIFAIISGCIMIFIMDEVAAASREGARYASVHGDGYAFKMKVPPATAADITAEVKKNRVLLRPENITCIVSWDAATRIGHYATVTVKYQWTGMMIFGPQEFSSTSTAMITY
jgi:Flp pilus assembly protein TadG